MSWPSNRKHLEAFLYGFKTSVCPMPDDYSFFKVQAELTIYRQPKDYYSTEPEECKTLYCASNGWTVKSLAWPHVPFVNDICSKDLYIRGRDGATNDTTIIQYEKTPNPSWLIQLQETLAEFSAWANYGVVADFKPIPEKNRYGALEIE